jgi:hypothetical protein
MPDTTSRNRRRRSTGRNQRNWDTPRWEDAGPLAPGKDFIRKATEKASGREGVLKHLFRKPRRFYDEAMNMQRLNGTSGILPVWDMDDTRPGQPRWYAMPRAQLLSDALGDDATLRDVVRAIAFLADVLARLAEDGTYHRDIKPANLFWWDRGPVLADFGIAAWGTTGRPQIGTAHHAGATRPGEKLGPANFIAPEMRHSHPADRGERADVYSLAKTLFVLALPHRGPYPPDGTHRVGGDEFSMGVTGGGHSLAELGHVLEAATEFDPDSRLLMSDFRDELYAWLSRHPGEQFRRLGDQANYERLVAFVLRSSRVRRDREQTRTMMVARIGEIAEALTGDKDAWAEDEREGILGYHDWEPDLVDDDGFNPEGGIIWMATRASGGRRIVMWAVLDGYVCFAAESQTGGPPWTLERQWDRTGWARPRMPRTADQLKNLTDEVVASITGASTATCSIESLRPPYRGPRSVTSPRYR